MDFINGMMAMRYSKNRPCGVPGAMCVHTSSSAKLRALCGEIFYTLSDKLSFHRNADKAGKIFGAQFGVDVIGHHFHRID